MYFISCFYNFTSDVSSSKQNYFRKIFQEKIQQFYKENEIFIQMQLVSCAPDYSILQLNSRSDFNDYSIRHLINGVTRNSYDLSLKELALIESQIELTYYIGTNVDITNLNATILGGTK